MNNLTIGWIGTGVMGFSMCTHILKRFPKPQNKLLVFNRTKAKADALLTIGAQWATPQEMAQRCDVILIMLGYPKDVQEMCLGSQGILQAMRPGTLFVDHTTSKPELARRIFVEGAKRNIACIDAPVSGGDIGAKEGKLVSMCGGDKDTFEKVKPIFDAYSRSVQLAGPAGMGQHTKMANQIILAGNMIGMVEGLMYASKMGLNLEQTVQTICSGAASSVSLSVMGKRILNGNYDPGFFVEHYIKDMEIALEEAARCDLALPCLSLVKQLYVGLKAQGGGKLGTQALVKVLEQMNNHKVVQPQL